MLWAEDVAAYVAEHGPELYHATMEVQAAEIVRLGLVPGSDLGVSNDSGFHEVRRGMVYLAGYELWTEFAKRRGWTALFAVDLRCIDPACIVPDEDIVQEVWHFEVERWVDVRPPDNDGQTGALARWADTTPGFDSREVTLKALARKRIAYRGHIPSKALRRVG